MGPTAQAVAGKDTALTNSRGSKTTTVGPRPATHGDSLVHSPPRLVRGSSTTSPDGSADSSYPSLSSSRSIATVTINVTVSMALRYRSRSDRNGSSRQCGRRHHCPERPQEENLPRRIRRGVFVELQTLLHTNITINSVQTGGHKRRRSTNRSGDSACSVTDLQSCPGAYSRPPPVFISALHYFESVDCFSLQRGCGMTRSSSSERGHRALGVVFL